MGVYEGNCYFYTPELGEVTENKCGQREAGATLATVDTTALFEVILEFLRSKVDGDDGPIDGILAFTTGTYETTKGLDNREITWPNGVKTNPPVDMWVVGRPDTLVQSGHNRHKTQIAIQVRKDPTNPENGYNNRPPTYKHEHLCVFSV